MRHSVPGRVFVVLKIGNGSCRSCDRPRDRRSRVRRRCGLAVFIDDCDLFHGKNSLMIG